ncbi:hypothetical protein FJY63_01165 [Candidatus Sumerlaeota bacterium]|nr:hypothetical protein [Candidatus Sumerlaeota bacterium]
MASGQGNLTAERDAPFLSDSERVWSLVVWLGILWLGPPHVGVIWAVLCATAILAVLFLAPAARPYLSRGFLFPTILILLMGLFVAQIAIVVARQKGREGLSPLGHLIIGLALLVVILAIAGLIAHFRWRRRRAELPGASFELTARGLLIPLILCGAVSLLATSLGNPTSTHVMRAAAVLLFLFHFYAYFPKQRWVLRWWGLILLLSLALLYTRAELRVRLILLPARLTTELPVPLTVGAFLLMLRDIPRAISLSIADPAVASFFLPGPVDPAGLDTVLDKHLLDSLTGFELGGRRLGPMLGLALPLLIALRIVGGQPRRRLFGYTLWCAIFSVATIWLWGTLSDPFLYRPLFLAETWFLWLRQGLPLQIALSVGLLASAPLAAALSGQLASGESQTAGSSESAEISPGAVMATSGSLERRMLRRLFSEKFWLPVFISFFVFSGLIGSLCIFVVNGCMGTFHGVIEPRPGEVAAGPILRPLFSKPEPSLLTRTFSEGFVPTQYLPFLGIPRKRAREFSLPTEAACDRLLSESRRPEVRQYLEAFERAAECDVCNWRFVDAGGKIVIPGYRNMRDAARFIAARSSVEMARGQWEAARQDIRRLVRFGAVLGSEGLLIQRMIGVANRDIGVRCAFLAAQISPKEELPRLFAELRSLDRWVRCLADMEALREAEPELNWPARLVFPGLMLPRCTRAITVDKCGVAQFRMLLLACATQIRLAETGQMPATMDDLEPLFDGMLPLDPFSRSGQEFRANFSPERVRFSAVEGALPREFDTQKGQYGVVVIVTTDRDVWTE